jgi:hypothetical protein
MKILASLFVFFLLIVSFQNCAQRNVAPDGLSAGSGIGVNMVSAKDPSKVVLWNPTKDEYLDLNLADGKMIAYEQYGESRGSTYCLTDSESSELKSILATSDICEPQVDYEAIKDKTCTMLYKFPYVSIVKDNNEYRLGEMNTGCDQPVDLCGDRAQMLKNFTTMVVSSLDNRLCK